MKRQTKCRLVATVRKHAFVAFCVKPIGLFTYKMVKIRAYTNYTFSIK